MRTEGYNEINDRWRKHLLDRFYIIAWIVLVTEVIIFFFDEWAGLLFLPIPVYLFRFLVFPFMINFAAIGAAYRVLYSEKRTEESKDFMVSLACFAVCACVELTHYVFAPVLCAPTVAIYISSIFGNRETTKKLTIYSVITLILSTILAANELRAGENQLYLDVAIAFVITMSSYFIAILMIRREAEQTQSLSESYQKQMELSEQLNRDVLTGLYNRKAMFNMLRYEIRQMNDIHLAVLDIDDFKLVNDRFGHAKGDEVLLFIAKLFHTYVGKLGFPIRFGGEEFAIIFSNTQDETVIMVLEKIRRKLSEYPFLLSDNGTKTYITVSCGVVKYKDTQSIDDFFKSADHAMYMAKSKGKNNVVYLQGNY